jgi:arsenate reductase
MGAPVMGHWGLPDPADVEGGDDAVDAAFEETWQALSVRVRAFLATPFETMEPRHLQDFLNEIGRMEGAA